MFASLTNFHPTIGKTYYFYKEYQPLFKDMAQKLAMEVIPCLEFEKTKNQETGQLIFHYSSEEIYHDFVTTAVTGRHKNIHYIIVIHKFFHSSKLSRTIDLNITHIVLFKSATNVLQIDQFARQPNKTEFARECYKHATSQPLGCFLVDFDPKTSESLQL